MIFSERYKDLIDVGHGESKEYICGEISFEVKKKVANVLQDFGEPITIKPNRYDNYEVNTTAFQIAVDELSKLKGFPVIPSENDSFYGLTYQDVLGNTFAPWLFDLIELQYSELSIDEKKEFQVTLNALFQDNNIPWILCDGYMIKIDKQQFELDLQARAIAALHELKDSNPKFQSAYNELIKSCEFLEKGSFAEAISNAGKSYESVLKVICDIQKGTADQLTKEYIDKILCSLPATMKKDGFREKVLMALPFIRNNSSSDHGAGESIAIISRSLAQLAINLSAAMSTFLIEEYMVTIQTLERTEASTGEADGLLF